MQHIKWDSMWNYPDVVHQLIVDCLITIASLKMTPARSDNWYEHLKNLSTRNVSAQPIKLCKTHHAVLRSISLLYLFGPIIHRKTTAEELLMSVGESDDSSCSACTMSIQIRFLCSNDAWIMRSRKDTALICLLAFRKTKFMWWISQQAAEEKSNQETERKNVSNWHLKSLTG